MRWLQWVLDIIARLSGGMTAEERATQERRLGEAQQQRDDAQQSATEAKNAVEISKQVDEAGVDAAADDLDGGLSKPADRNSGRQ